MCTRTFWNNNRLAPVVGRTMDWPESTQPVLVVFPSGIQRDGAKVATQTVVSENPAQWTSKYGSLVTTAYGLATVDGVNEKGLAIHLLYLTATDFGPRDKSKQGVQAGMWGQYLLDNAASVAEALELMKDLQPVMVELEGKQATVHLAMEDVSGDSAIIEYVGGKPVVHQGPEYRVMTNDPIYDEQLANLASYDFTNATRQTPLPGNVDPQHRFVRAAYYMQMLPEPASEREAIASILAIARNVSVPFGAPNRLPGTLYNTEYRTAIDLKNLRYFFELTTAPNVIWVSLEQFDLTPGAAVRMLPPDDIHLVGNVTTKFEAVEHAPF
ncbi:linear amide C-N hydrolase [Aeoliella sp. ICT_H6.2]|uniref:Linear amide C-N hydrolase n=1 Tax=Aeoliella straminimaris TaxID=2954799 RepID=A0A9X2FFB1_9BACT|nr:linear amide C-N hydrolase [Aeoliella straminimaris]MCO6045229.1 linear amide C-N hydrolase [Aeoliella straminimaris]